MPWSEADRAKYDVIRERYSSDLSDTEFGLIFPLLPTRKRLGRRPTSRARYERAVPFDHDGAEPFLRLARDRLVGERTALINQLRAILLERGMVAPQGKRKLEQFVAALMDEWGGAGLSPRMIVLVSASGHAARGRAGREAIRCLRPSASRSFALPTCASISSSKLGGENQLQLATGGRLRDR